MQTVPSSAGTRAVTILTHTELGERRDAFDEAARALAARIARWTRDDVFVVPDSSFYINHPDKLGDLDLRDPLGVWDSPIHLLIPIVILDELDRLKQTGASHARWRAGHALAVIDNRLKDPTQPARLRVDDFTPLESDGLPLGEVTVEIVFDPIGHLRRRSTTTRSLTGRWQSRPSLLDRSRCSPMTRLRQHAGEPPACAW